MRETHEYKGLDFHIDLVEAGGRWNWSVEVESFAAHLAQIGVRTQEVARAEAIDAARKEINRLKGPSTYTRKSDGVVFTYEVDYWLEENDRANWDARVYCDGDLVGTPNGRMAKINNLRGKALFDLFSVITEDNIEKQVGVGR